MSRLHLPLLFLTRTALCKTLLLAGVFSSGIAMDARAQQPSKEPPSPFRKQFDPNALGLEAKLQGEYVGTLSGKPVAAQVVARGDQRFHALLFNGGLPGDGWDNAAYILLESDPLENQQATFRSVSADSAATAVLSSEGFTVRRGADSARLTRVERKSPTLGLPPPAGAVVLFDGSRGAASLDAFQEDKTIEGTTVPMLYEDNLLAGAVSKQSFGDFLLHLEFLTGLEPDNIPWRRADSGVYLHSRYEVAIGDSFGFDFDLAGFAGPTAPTLFSSRIQGQKFPVLTGTRNPRTPIVCGVIFGYPSKSPNPCYPPLTWQTYDIDFRAPRFDAAGIKTADAVVSVRLNGHRVVDQQAVHKTTPHGAKGGEKPTGPVWIEGFGRRVLYRNIWVLEAP